MLEEVLEEENELTKKLILEKSEIESKIDIDGVKTKIQTLA
jgi:hypothetical protein